MKSTLTIPYLSTGEAWQQDAENLLQQGASVQDNKRERGVCALGIVMWACTRCVCVCVCVGGGGGGGGMAMMSTKN